jgi:hypothetical protein
MAQRAKEGSKMKRWSIITLIITMLLIVTTALPGCSLLKKIKPGSSTSSGTIDPSKPITSSWSMTRVSYEPPFPQTFPGFLVDQIFPKSPTWKVTISNGTLAISYDGRPTWYNPMGFTAVVKSTKVTEYDEKSCQFDDVGAISAAKLPGAMAILGTLTGGMEDIAIEYSDGVSIKMTSPTQIEANITYSARGTYTGGKGNDSFNYSGTLKYTGTKK